MNQTRVWPIGVSVCSVSDRAKLLWFWFTDWRQNRLLRFCDLAGHGVSRGGTAGRRTAPSLRTTRRLKEQSRAQLERPRRADAQPERGCDYRYSFLHPSTGWPGPGSDILGCGFGHDDHGLVKCPHQPNQGDRAENLEKAILGYHDALQVLTRDALPVEWARTTAALAHAYRDRIRADRADNLELSIKLYGQALQVFTLEAMPIEWANTTMHRANTYLERVRGDRAENLEHALEGYRQALRVFRKGSLPRDWAMASVNWAIAYDSRIRGDRAENLEQAIRHYQEALQVITHDEMPLEWAATMMNLGVAYEQRIRADKAENLERAIEAYQQALKVRTQQAMPVQWALTMMNVASAYAQRIQGNRADNMELAIEYGQNAFLVLTREAMPLKWAETMSNLATAYARRIRGDRVGNVKRAIEFYRQALTVKTREALPLHNRNTHANLAELLFAEGHWIEAITAYQSALSAHELLYEIAATPEARLAELREVQGLPTRLAYSLAKVGRLADAVTELEQGRARTLAEAIRIDESQLELLRPSERSALEEMRGRIFELQNEARLPEHTHGKRDFITLSSELRKARTKLDEVVAWIRGRLPDFLPMLSFAEISATASIAPLVYLLTTRAGGLALIVGHEASQEAVGVWLPELTDAGLRATAGEYSTAYQRRRASARDKRSQQAWLGSLDKTLRWLWDVALGATVDALRPATKAVLIPCGLLGMFPLHAAWNEDPSIDSRRRYALDSVTFTYAPSARALLMASKVAARTAPDGLLAVDDPRPVHASSLPNSAHEVETACSTFTKKRIIRHEEATRGAVLAALPDYSVLHFSCHAYADFTQPLSSALAMANDEPLSLRDFLNLRLGGTRLAILSACETGIPGTELPDEVVSLPTGLLQAGSAAVVASLWSVQDVSTMMLMTRFYELWRMNGRTASAALGEAQQWLRDTTNGEKKEYFKKFIPEGTGTQMLLGTTSTLYQAIVLSNPNSQDFAHPYHWAAFGFVGV